MKAIIECSGLTKRFGPTLALDNIDLAVSPSRIVGLIGSNGAGKSTLLRHIVGLYLPDKGACATFGVEAARLGPDQLARIGYVHQEGELINWMKTGQLIRYVRAYYPTWNRDLEERYVREFELKENDPVASLSPGQRQKLAILLAVGFEPALLILDEPASALDPLARRKFLDLLLEMIQTENRTILISSHILSDIEKVVDHIVIMHAGRILRDGPLDELQESFLKVTLSCADPLPDPLPFQTVIESKRAGGQVILTLRDADETQVLQTADRLKCRADLRRLALDELYELTLRERTAR